VYLCVLCGSKSELIGKEIAMYKTTLAGHPLHPQLIAAPSALIPVSLVLDLMYLTNRKRSYADAAYYTLVGGYFGGLGAAIAGAIDYFSITSGTRTKRIANIHAFLNIGLLGLLSADLLLRRGKRVPTGTLPVLLSAAGTLGILVSAWYGGELVFSHGVRVKGVQNLDEAKDIKLPVDEKLEEAFKTLADKVALEDEQKQIQQHSKTAGGR
jgi:uncharacterized membrane protein